MRIGGQLVPQGMDAVAVQLSIAIEVGVCQVETHIHHTYHDTLSRIGLMLLGSRIGRQQMADVRHGVHQRLRVLAGLYAQYGRMVRQRLQLLEWDGGNGDVVPLGIFPTTVVVEQSCRLCVGSLDKGRDVHRLALCPVQGGCCRLCSLANQG